METIDIIDALIEEAEFWLDETGMVNMPVFSSMLRANLHEVCGLNTDASGVHMHGYGSDFATRANFCLLIAAALESEQ